MSACTPTKTLETTTKIFNMAYSPSPTLTKGNSTYYNRTLTTSPPPLNKREKRKLAFEERCNEIGQNFARNRNQQYLVQNHSIQAALTYITKQDAFTERPLDDWPPSVRDAIVSIIDNSTRRKLDPAVVPRATQFAASYTEEVNQAIEHRDARLAHLVVCIFLPVSLENQLTLL